jgi:DNA-binding transcriptional MerR regulator
MEYSTLQLAKAFDWSRATVQRWLEQERITPKKKAEGRGDRSLFSENDVRCLLLFQLFRDAGFPTTRASEYAKDVMEQPLDDLSLRRNRYLIIGRRRDGKGFEYGTVSRKPEIPADLPLMLKPNGFLIVVNLLDLFTDARTKLESIG